MTQQYNALKCVLSLLIVFSIFLTASCSSIISSSLSGMMSNLSDTILNSNDLEMVEDGAPAYLLLIDSMVNEESDNEDMLITAANLFTAYADTFISDKKRARKMSDKAFNYAKRALCSRNQDICPLNKFDFAEFKFIISKMGKKDIDALYTLGSSWASWVRANSNDFNAIADIPRIEIIMKRVAELDETYKDGSAFFYLGISATLIPPALGGDPEKGRRYFEKAIELSNGKNFMINVVFAKQYARMLFDRDLHDRLLKEILEQDPNKPEYTLINTYAQKQAEKLLASADEYF